MTESARRSRLIGYASILSTVLIWGVWIALTREAVTHSLPIATIALLRVITPAIVLAPWTWRAGFFARGRIVPLILCVLGAGAPFVLLATTGVRYASSADFAALVPGTMPILVAALCVLFFKERLDWLRALGFICCTLGVFVIAGRSLLAADANANFGHILLLTAALNYSIYTLAFRRSGLTPLEATGLISFWSLLMMLPIGVPQVVAELAAGNWHEILFHAVLQGVFSGLLALLFYNEAVARLGASTTAAFAALVPVVATLLAIPLIGEWPDTAAVIGVATTSLGVLLASGVLAKNAASGRKSAG
jgi:drug/metabolite transporter (DMT)-like permease